MELDLEKLYENMRNLRSIKIRWHPLIHEIFKQARLIKLWKKIATLYSCISIDDIIEQLKLGDEFKMDKKMVLSMLMQCDISHDNTTKFSIDLIEDKVYFGKDITVLSKVTDYPKNKFIKSNSYGNFLSNEFEYINDIGVYHDDELSVLGKKKGKDEVQESVVDIFERLKRTREYHSPSLKDGSDQQFIEFGEQYRELAEIVSLQFMKSRKANSNLDFNSN
ncbi:hypothetical protein Kpol_1020p24 [Vanderwaltozyma polyspora DSM 70294]|uniref:Uncharacterized protein n=1 Tax=Vanderwaltozyma polyspora (strain ATCC 22028 / DSM 70294 / BCRC 21397 / CBS 2163 / NBRC 10782 / NRRL Y-8283 / UCD 57-17) TaxID=436907 RepID=A7TLD5_VANPO|nr:uncharacterized protein Kpol_1020p24 [Vanderwaltozyma polyspora DSM 70294]EDO16916.1 hypothetical protein Kpol_1020p24 [Vanderwaltozyma polyspora DSM 70294]